MDQDTGILRQLPPPLPVDMPPPPPVKERNVFEVLANANNQLLVEGRLMEITELKDAAIEFLTNPNNSDDLPEMRPVNKGLCKERISQVEAILATDAKNFEAKQELKKWQNRLAAVEYFGPYRELPPSAIISLQNDNGTSYDTYIQVQNELQAAISELRNGLSKQTFGVLYNELDPLIDEDKEKILAIRAVHPQKVSEAEPKDTGN